MIKIYIIACGESSIFVMDAGKYGFQGGLTNRKYVSMTKASRATAFREISDLLEKGVVIQSPAKGRSVSYDLKWG